MNKIIRTFLLLPLCVTIYGCSKSQPAAEKTWQISFDDGIRASQSKDYSDAETSYRQALTSAQAFGKDDVRLAKTYFALGEVYTAEGKTEDAKRAFTNAYGLYRALWTSQTNAVDKRDFALELATTTLHLANIACDSLRMDDADRLYNEALAVEESALGSDDLKGQILQGKEKLYKMTGRAADAEKIQAQISELKALPSVDETKDMTWKQLNQAGQSAYESGNLAKAEKLFTAGIERATKSVQKAESMRGLARIYDQRKEYERAIQQLEEARPLLLRKDEHQQALADNYNSEGWIYFGVKDYGKAEKCFLDALHLMNKKEHLEQERARVSLQGLTKSFAEDGKESEAEKYATQKVDLTVEMYGKQDSRYPEDLLAVAILQAKQKKNSEAAKGFQAVIDIEEKDPSPRYMLAALDSYAKFLRDTKQNSLADSVELRAKNLRAEFE
ncbi:MAG TPA: tetratricopeptide repeat protein [Drouetiella sp.]